MNNYVEAIEKYGFFIATPIGISMLPLLRERVDTVKLVKPLDLKKYDIAMFERDDGKLVLHRIMKIRKNHTYDFCGDNQIIIEKGIREDQILAKVEGFYREEKYISCQDEEYLKYVKKLIKSRPKRFIKYICSRIKNKIKRILKGNKNG